MHNFQSFIAQRCCKELPFVLIQWVEVLLCLVLRELHVLLETSDSCQRQRWLAAFQSFIKEGLRTLILSKAVRALKNGIKQNTFSKHRKISLSPLFPSPSSCRGEVVQVEERGNTSWYICTLYCLVITFVTWRENCIAACFPLRKHTVYYIVFNKLALCFNIMYNLSCSFSFLRAGTIKTWKTLMKTRALHQRLWQSESVSISTPSNTCLTLPSTLNEFKAPEKEVF